MSRLRLTAKEKMSRVYAHGIAAFPDDALAARYISDKQSPRMTLGRPMISVARRGMKAWHPCRPVARPHPNPVAGSLGHGSQEPFLFREADGGNAEALRPPPVEPMCVRYLLNARTADPKFLADCSKCGANAKGIEY